MGAYTWVTCPTCGREYASGYRRSHEDGRSHRGALRRAAEAARPKRGPRATLELPRRLASFATGTGWYQGETWRDDSPADRALLERMSAVVGHRRISRTDTEALEFWAQEASYLYSCSDDTYNPDSVADRAAARRFLAKLAELGIRPGW